MNRQCSRMYRHGIQKCHLMVYMGIWHNREANKIALLSTRVLLCSHKILRFETSYCVFKCDFIATKYMKTSGLVAWVQSTDGRSFMKLGNLLCTVKDFQTNLQMNDIWHRFTNIVTMVKILTITKYFVLADWISVVMHLHHTKGVCVITR